MPRGPKNNRLLRNATLAILLWISPMAAHAEYDYPEIASDNIIAPVDGPDFPRIDWRPIFDERYEWGMASRNHHPWASTLSARRIGLGAGIMVYEHKTKDGLEYQIKFPENYDNSQYAGCLFKQYNYFIIKYEVCPEFVSPEQALTIRQRYERLAKHVGEVSVPPVTGENLRRAILLEQHNLRVSMSKPACFTGVYSDAEVEQFAGVEMGEIIDHALLWSSEFPIVGQCN